MTLFLSFRTQAIAGGIGEAQLYRITPGQAGWRPLAQSEIAAALAGKHLLFVVHGFNVNQREADETYRLLEPELGLGVADQFVGVLWPGDFWLPAINYPFEGDDAEICGGRLAAFCNRHAAGAASLSFFSHSLGGRLVLEALTRLETRARQVCLAAAAVDCDCFAAAYAPAALKADRFALLASRRDLVLKLAYRLGDPIGDLLQNDPPSVRAALGYAGACPRTPIVSGNWQIADGDDYGHGSYLPPGSGAEPRPWRRVAQFFGRCFRDEPRDWPA